MGFIQPFKSVTIAAKNAQIEKKLKHFFFKMAREYKNADLTITNT